MNTHLVYLDNAATSWPKPPDVAEAMTRFLAEVGANPGRAGHRLANESARIVYDTREAVAALFNAGDPLRVVFTRNATEAINLALKGLLDKGDHAVTTGVEHNSVMRPLRALQERGVELSVASCSPHGFVDPDAVAKAVKPGTRLIAVTHASNVVGSIAPVREIGTIARGKGLCLLIDAAQTAGALDIDMQRDNIDLLAFTGHKSLYGPMGTGGLVFGPRIDISRIEPLTRGGTGSRSEQETQPAFAPDKYESGTPNVVGLAGLLAGVRWVRARGVEHIRRNEMVLTQQCIDGLRAIDGVTVYGGLDAARQTATVSFCVAGVSVSELGLALDEDFGILCRVGLHCAPVAHRTMGTFPGGTVRFSMGAFNTKRDIDAALSAVARLAVGAGA
ncbi:MAG: aminotransferase class V-fold PLP-dependent enzyme [Chitinivibrionales bacterium]|nr:aminotransferase class V-fold PLP-dependent enzyme [Chitinivibrionales bacterium]MBD3394715.1 aminotransferase class V-fold PLP-dependent enzyme [Chitinivibrionales bacterium]